MKAAQFRVSSYFAKGSEPSLATVRSNVAKGIWPGHLTHGVVYVDIDAFEEMVKEQKPPEPKPFNPVYRR